MRPQRTRHRTAGALLAVALPLGLLAACSDEQPSAAPDPSSTPTASTTPTAEPSSSPTEAPGPTRPERPRTGKDTPAARQAFARHVIEAWGYALGTNDAAVVTRLSPPGARCQGCRELQAELSRRERQGWFVDFPGVTVRRLTVARADEPRTYTATARVDIPASRSFYEDGSYRNDNQAHRNATFVVRMRHQKAGFVLLAFTLR